MTRPLVPVDGRRQDWPRLVSQATNRAQVDIEALRNRFTSRTITATGSATTSDYLILVDATAGAVTVNLPAAADSAGAFIVVKKTDAGGNAVTVDANASETIDGATTRALAAQYDAITIACDGTAWWIL